MNVDDFISQLYKQLGNGGAMYWNWYTDNLRPSQGYFVNGRVTPYCAEFVSCMLLWFDIPCIWFPDPCAFDSTCIPIYERYYAQSIRRGDIISFDWDRDAGGDHVGFVTDVYDWGCHTIEGNTGPDLLVMERDRYWSDILFGIRPQYGDDIVTDADYENIANRVVEKLSIDLGNGITVLARLVWGAKNRDLETHDTYQILRDIRNSLGIKDGQKYPTQESIDASIMFEDTPISYTYSDVIEANKKLNQIIETLKEMGIE